jgi:hypothetical protein
MLWLGGQTCTDPETHLGSNDCVMNADGSDQNHPTGEGVDWREAGLQWSGWAVARLQTGAAGAGQHLIGGGVNTMPFDVSSWPSPGTRATGANSNDRH